MRRILLITFLCFVFILELNAQNITGLPGLVSIPTAEINGDGVLTLGVSYFDKDYLNLYRQNYDGLAVYAGFSFLPFVEVGMRFTRLLNYPEAQALGDRMPSVRIKLINEGNILPSVLFGAHDFIRTTESKSSYSTATYFVLTKNYALMDKITMKITGGYGFRIFTSSAYQFEKFFYGTSVTLFNTIDLMGEYDSKQFNSGFRVNPFSFFSFTVGLMNLKELCATSCVMIRL